MADSHKGGCLCGEIAYLVSGRPLDAGYCHCTVCRRASGAPVVAWGTVDKERFSIVKGAPTSYHSSPRGARQLCARCGTQLTFQYTKEPKTIDFTLASLENPEAIAPEYHIWTKSRIRWFDTADKLPRHDDSGPDTWA